MHYRFTFCPPLFRTTLTIGGYDINLIIDNNLITLLWTICCGRQLILVSVKVTCLLRKTFLGVCLAGHESLRYSQGGQLSTENPMVVVNSHITPWACEDLDGIVAKRDICVNCHSTFECS